MPSPSSDKAKDLLEKIQRISKDVAAPNAADVDAQARFPKESLEALRREQLLSAAVPEEFGGAGCDLPLLAEMCQILGQGCSASGMVLAMHHIQVASIARHAGSSKYFQNYLREIVSKQELIASVTSEVGTSGDLRSSVSSVEPREKGFALNKAATTISYGEQADALLITTRRAPDATANDQVLVLVRKSDYTLERLSTWNTLGMRGTCSPSFNVKSTLSGDQVLPVPFSTIASQTMVPYSHVLWGGLWLGIATDAVSKARAFVRAEARRKPGTNPPGSLRLAEVAARLQIMRSSVYDVARRCNEIMSDPNGAEQLSSMGFTLQLNNLKISASQLVVEITTKAMGICGIQGYKVDSKFSLGRHLRDSHSAALMINNDRIYLTNAALLQVYKDDF